MSEAEIAAPAAEVAPAPVVDAPAPAAETATAAPSEGSAPASDPPTDAPRDEPSSSEPASQAAGDSESEPAPAPIDPESYEFTLPEAFTADATLEQAAREAFAANGVPKEAAQPLVDLFTATLTAQAESAQRAFEAQQSKWLNEIYAMPEFKEGPTRDKSLASIGRLIDTYGGPAAQGVKDAFNMYGIGNNPAIASFLAKLAAELDEGAPSASPRGPASVERNTKQSGVRGQHLSYPNTPAQ